eukprot:356675-Chlamydomonas_euryale.AAC.5
MVAAVVEAATDEPPWLQQPWTICGAWQAKERAGQAYKMWPLAALVIMGQTFCTSYVDVCHEKCVIRGTGGWVAIKRWRTAASIQPKGY